MTKTTSQDQLMPMLEMEYRGLRKVISGGQCGADRGGLEIARRWNIETGGWAPLGWKTAEGPRPNLSDFGLLEHHSADYKPRTKLNVGESDGTLIMATYTQSAGTRLTISTCNKLGKPYLLLDPEDDDRERVINWMIGYSIEVLNVAGNRDRVELGKIHYKAVFATLHHVFANLNRLGLLVAKA